VIDVMVTAVGCLLVTVTVFAVLVVVTATFAKASAAGLTVTGTTPLPLSDTVWGLLVALSVIVRVPVRLPVVVGVKVTLIVQFGPAGTEVPHVFVCPKSPETTIEETLKAVGRLFVNVTVFAVLEVPTASFPNDNDAGVAVAWSTPFPASAVVCGLLFAPSVTVKVPVREPVAPGVKVTFTVQLAPAFSDVPQLFVCPKSPVTAIGDKLRLVGKLFLSVTALAVLVMPTAWFPNERLAGETVACSTPVPVNETVCGLLLALSMTVRVPVRPLVAVGVNVTLIAQFAPAARDAPHVFVCAKSPEVLIEDMLRAEAVPFFSVLTFVLLVVETAWLPKDKLVGERVTLWAAKKLMGTKVEKMIAQITKKLLRRNACQCRRVAVSTWPLP
jgi:hypothetical protein